MEMGSRLGRRRPRRILIADDSAAALVWARLLLQDAGVEILTARTGAAAFVTALAEHPDLILLDAEMPGVGGLELCRRLRASPSMRRTPIVMATPPGVAVPACLASGGSDVVTKPYDRTELRSTVARWLAHGARPTLALSTTAGPLSGSRPAPAPVLGVVRGTSNPGWTPPRPGARGG